jgi:putative ABC transport system permease protein
VIFGYGVCEIRIKSPGWSRHATAGANRPGPASPSGAGHGNREILVGGTALIHLAPVPLHPSVSGGVIVLAVGLALAGALLAGAFASWRAAGPRPADALARVA